MQISRQSVTDIQDGKKVTSSPLNAEFDNIMYVINQNDTRLQDTYTQSEVDDKINNAVATFTVASGIVFPTGTFTSGQLFYRSDLDVLFVYDAGSSNWLPVLSDNQILNQIKNVDGPSSGLNADMLDGKEASYFMPADAIPSHLGAPVITGTVTNIDTGGTTVVHNLGRIPIIMLTGNAGTNSGLNIQSVNNNSFVIEETTANTSITFPSCTYYIW